MAKKRVAAVVKIQIPAGGATPAPFAPASPDARGVAVPGAGAASSTR